MAQYPLNLYQRSNYMSYSARDIKILENPEEHFTWLKAEELSKKYKKNAEWIRIGLMACTQVGIPPDYFIEKYLKEIPLPKNNELLEAYAYIKQKGY